MAKTIWKYEFTSAELIVPMPAGAQVIHVAVQYGALPALWAIVDPDERKIERRFHIVGTGHGCPFTKEAHIGTGITDDGGHVWHVFEER